MNNHIDRHGLMAKKTGHGRRQVIVYRKDPTIRQPNYERTIISQRANLSGSCGFRHAPYVSDIDMGDSEPSESAVDSRVDWNVWTTVALLTDGARSCEFCYTIWLGLQQYRVLWESKWNRFNYLDALADHADEYTQEEYYILANKNLDGLEPVADRLVDERKIFLSLNYKQQKGYVEALLLIEPRGNSTYDRNRLLIALDYLTVEGESHLFALI